MTCDRDSTARFVSRRTLLKGGVATLVAGIGLHGLSAWANDLRVGATAPPAILVTLDGQSISTVDLVGQVIILTFWATWCAPCRDELSLLSSYAVRHADAGLRVLGFSLDAREKLAEVRRVARALSFPVGLFANSTAPGYGRIWRLPVNFTIDRAGRLIENGWRQKEPGWTPERLEQVVTPLLGFQNPSEIPVPSGGRVGAPAARQSD